MIASGDHPLTAMSVALSCGILSPDINRLLIDLPHNIPQGPPKIAPRDGDVCIWPRAFKDAAKPISPSEAVRLKLPPLAQPPPAPPGSSVGVGGRATSLPASKPVLHSPGTANTALLPPLRVVEHTIVDSSQTLAANQSAPPDHISPESDKQMTSKPALTVGAQVPRPANASAGSLATVHAELLSPGSVQAASDQGLQMSTTKLGALQSRLLFKEQHLQATARSGSLQQSDSTPTAASAHSSIWSWRSHRVAHISDDVAARKRSKPQSSFLGHAHSTPPGFPAANATQQCSGEFELGCVELVHAHSADPDLNRSEFEQHQQATGFTPALSALRCTLAEGKVLYPVKVREAMGKIAEGAQCILTGPAFEHLLQHADPAELELILRGTAVCSRMRPHQKPQLVQLLSSARLTFAQHRHFQVQQIVSDRCMCIRALHVMRFACHAGLGLWGLRTCISFLIFPRQQGQVIQVTCDHHLAYASCLPGTHGT